MVARRRDFQIKLVERRAVLIREGDQVACLIVGDLDDLPPCLSIARGGE
jgi:hypothetical protein